MNGLDLELTARRQAACSREQHHSNWKRPQHTYVSFREQLKDLHQMA